MTQSTLTGSKGNNGKEGRETQREIRVVEFFCGAGGFSADLPKDLFRILSANDLDHDACESYRANHPNVHVVEGKIEGVNASMMLAGNGDVDLILGGPSCQGFSTVGAKKEDDERNGLFRHYLRLINEIGPKMFVFENVHGFKVMYGGRMFRELRELAGQMGYDLKAAVLDAVNYGVPQHRKRVIIMGVKRGLGLNFGDPDTFSDIMPPTHSGPGLPAALTLRDAISDLPAVDAGGSAAEYVAAPLTEYQGVMREGSTGLTEHVAANHGEGLLGVLRLVPRGGSILDVPEELKRSCFHNSYGRLRWDKPAPTITRNFGTPSSGRNIHPDNDRGLTTREGARLQSFPDGYVFVGSKASKTLQIGNAVPPILGRALCLAARSVILAAEDATLKGVAA